MTPRVPTPTEPFDALLQEKLEELDADEASQARLRTDPVQQLGIKARQMLRADASLPLARPSHNAYTVEPLDTVVKKVHSLDVVS